MPFVVSSCGDDDDNEPSDSDYAEMIIGTWSDEGHDNWYDGGNAGDAYGYEFRKKGVCYVHGSNYGSGTYQIIGNKLIISFFCDRFGDYYTDTYTIKKLTKKVLVLQDNEYYDEEEYYRVN